MVMYKGYSSDLALCVGNNDHGGIFSTLMIYPYQIAVPVVMRQVVVTLKAGSGALMFYCAVVSLKWTLEIRCMQTHLICVPSLRSLTSRRLGPKV